MKILNLYAGIGGNRKLWGDEHQITVVEYKKEIADIYHDFFPNDTIVVGDAHQYLLDHFSEFDFIWTSPPCQTHTVMNITNGLNPYKDNTKQLKQGGGIQPRYPKMELYQEIIFLKTWFRGKWCVENVVAYYEPLIPPAHFGDHWFWTNFILRDFIGNGRNHMGSVKELEITKGFNLDKYKGDKRTWLRNCVEPELAKHILDLAINPIELQKSFI